MHTSPYIGRTGLVDAVIRTSVATRFRAGDLTDPLERRMVFSGPPGVGKTQLARDLALFFAEYPVNVEFRMGSAVSVEVIRDWLRAAAYRPLWGTCIVKIIDEVETIPTTALTEGREYFDTLPPHALIFATSNKSAKDLPQTLQTRFKVYKFQGIQTSAVAELLARRFPEVPAGVLQTIATDTAGNVRAALADASSHRDVLLFQQLQQEEAA